MKFDPNVKSLRSALWRKKPDMSMMDLSVATNISMPHLYAISGDPSKKINIDTCDKIFKASGLKPCDYLNVSDFSEITE